MCEIALTQVQENFALGFIELHEGLHIPFSWKIPGNLTQLLWLFKYEGQWPGKNQPVPLAPWDACNQAHRLVPIPFYQEVLNLFFSYRGLYSPHSNLKFWGWEIPDMQVCLNISGALEISRSPRVIGPVPAHHLDLGPPVLHLHAMKAKKSQCIDRLSRD